MSSSSAAAWSARSCRWNCQRRVEVVCLERGRRYRHRLSETHVYDERSSTVTATSSRTWRATRSHIEQQRADGAADARDGGFKPGEMVGGTAAHWGGNARRFLPHDFEMRSRIQERYGESFIPKDCNLQDWGVTWDEIEPDYDQFEKIFGVGGKAGNLEGEIQPGGNPHEGPRSREYPNPPTRRTTTANFRRSGELAWLRAVPRTDRGHDQDYRNLYRVQMLECARGGFCSSHVCAQGAKANPLTVGAARAGPAATFELRPLCNVLRVNTDSTGTKATGVTYIDARGSEVEQPAEHRMLAPIASATRGCCCCRASARPMIRAPAKASSAGIIVPARRPGACVLRGSRVQSFYRRRPGQHVDRRIQRRRDRPGPLGFVGGAYVKLDKRGDADQGQDVPPGTPRWGGEWKKAVAHNYRRNITIDIHGILPELSAQLPRSGSDLQRCVRPAAAAHDVRLERERAADDEIPERALHRDRPGAQRFAPGRQEQGHAFRYHGIPEHAQCRGRRDGQRSSTSVVNKYLQSWDVSNLFVVGGSAFPQNPANGPTETSACWPVGRPMRSRKLRSQPGLLGLNSDAKPCAGV